MTDTWVEDVERRTPPGWYGLACGEGWYPIVSQLHEKLKLIDPDYQVFQIKEKFGTLRYYSSLDGNGEVRKLVRQAELASAETCEVCGAPGVLRERAWLKTLCDQHAEARRG